MEDTLCVAIIDPFETLAHNMPNSIFAHCASPQASIRAILVAPNQIEQRAFDQLKDEVQIVLDPDHLLEFNDVHVV